MRGKAPSDENMSSPNYVHVDISEDWLDTHVSPDGAHYRFANDTRGVTQLITLCRQRGAGKININAAGEHGARAQRALIGAGLSVTAANPLRAQIFGDAGRARKGRGAIGISLAAAVIALGLAGLAAEQWSRSGQTLESAAEATKRWMSDATQKFKNAPGAIASFLAEGVGPVFRSNRDDKAEQRDSAAASGRGDEFRLSAGDRAASLQSLGDSQAIVRALSAAGPGDLIERRRGLSVAYEKPGEARRAQVDLEAELQSFREKIAAGKALLAANPGDVSRRRDLAVAQEKLGDAQLAQGDLAAALQSFRDSFALGKALSDANPRDPGLRRDLAVANAKLGEVQLARGDLPAALQSDRDSFDIFKALSAANPNDAGRRRDLAVAHEKLGDVQLAQGDAAAALQSFRDGVAFSKALSDADPRDAGRRRDLAVAYEKLGDVQLARVDLAAAARSYRDGFEIFRALSDADPGDAGLRRDLFTICLRLSAAEPANARDYLLKAQAIVKELTDSERSSSFDRAWAAEIERRFKGLGAAPVGSPGAQK